MGYRQSDMHESPIYIEINCYGASASIQKYYECMAPQPSFPRKMWATRPVWNYATGVHSQWWKYVPWDTVAHTGIVCSLKTFQGSAQGFRVAWQAVSQILVRIRPGILLGVLVQGVGPCLEPFPYIARGKTRLFWFFEIVRTSSHKY